MSSAKSADPVRRTQDYIETIRDPRNGKIVAWHVVTAPVNDSFDKALDAWSKEPGNMKVGLHYD
jgi:hypothetical protein